jgi:hypothetical protein
LQIKSFNVVIYVMKIIYKVCSNLFGLILNLLQIFYVRILKEMEEAKREKNITGLLSPERARLWLQQSRPNIRNIDIVKKYERGLRTQEVLYVVSSPALRWEVPGSTPGHATILQNILQSARGTRSSALVAGPTQSAHGTRRSVMRPTRGTRVSGQTDAWDPCVRSDPRGTRVAVRTGPAWDPCVRSDRRVEPACQVGPAWDLCVRSDPRGSRVTVRIGPACQVGPTRGTRVSGLTDV